MQPNDGKRGTGAPAPAAFPPGIAFLNTINKTVEATGSSRSRVYEMIAAGELDAVKDGSRTLVTGESILRRTANLPRAKFKVWEAA